MIIVPDELFGWREAGDEILHSETRELRVFTREASEIAKDHLEGLKDLDIKDLRRNMEWIALPSLLLVFLISAVLLSLDLSEFALGLFIVYGALVFAMGFADNFSRRKRMRNRYLAWNEFVRKQSYEIPDGLPLELIRSDNDLLIDKLSKISAIESKLMRDDYVSPLATGDAVREELMSARGRLMREVAHFLAPLSSATRTDKFENINPDEEDNS